MIDDLMKIGDRVAIMVPKVDKYWECEPCPNGTKATILGFSEIHCGRLSCRLKPGVYVNRSYVKIRLDNGEEDWKNSCYLELADEEEGKRRLAVFRKYQKQHPDDWPTKEFIRELPETPFWEGDFVRVHSRSAFMVISRELPPEQDPDVFQIIRIDYDYLNEKTMMETKYPAYNISSKLGAGWHTSASEDNMALVERGPAWKFYHNESLTCKDLREEADLFERLGRTKELRNPANGLYKWTKDEVLDAIQKGIVHGFSMSNGFLGNGPHIRAQRFIDEDLGRRIAQATLAGFGITI